MYVILSKEEYDNLVNEGGKSSLFMDKLNNELELKLNDIQVYKQMGSKDIVNELKYEYAGMLFVKDMF